LGTLHVFLVLSLERRHLLLANVTAHPHAAWAAQQIIESATPGVNVLQLTRDRDGIYGAVFDRRVNNLGIRQLHIASRSPWQNGYAERPTCTTLPAVGMHVRTVHAPSCR
jgi:hypothetical protein